MGIGLSELEMKEIVQKLRDAGHSDLVDTLLENDTKVHTKRGRLNKSGACRVLGWKAKQLEDALEACRELLPEMENR